MRILYTPLHLLSSRFCEKVVPKRNLIPGGRTRPQRVKYFLLKLSKIFDNYLGFGHKTSCLQKFSTICKKYLTTPPGLGYNRRHFEETGTKLHLIASGHKKDLTSRRYCTIIGAAHQNKSSSHYYFGAPTFEKIDYD